MDDQPDVLATFLFHNRSAYINTVEGVDESEESKFVVMANIYGIIKSDQFGVELAVADHSRRAIFSLRGAAHWKFAEQHIRIYAPNEPIVDPYEMAQTWNKTYLFLINPSVQLTIMGHTSFAVTDICMEKFAIDQFALYKFTEEDMPNSGRPS